ncbi:MAG: thiamine pyrophosphate-binding protein [Deltaproteobacteria bacterium]|nr:thiamine pyrophosphate-binding protein [Deltaproteobacteria bacterium]
MSTRHECLRRLTSRLGDELVVTGPGATARELCALNDRDGNLYRVYMGGVVPMALGLALALPHRQVIALDGDGSLLMGLTILPVVGHYKPKNLLVIVFDNGIYEGAGKHPTLTARDTSLAAIARAVGIQAGRETTDVEAFEQALDLALQANEIGFLVVKVDPGSQAPYAGLDGVENKYRFIRHIEKTESVRVFEPPARKSTR